MMSGRCPPGGGPVVKHLEINGIMLKSLAGGKLNV